MQITPGTTSVRRSIMVYNDAGTAGVTGLVAATLPAIYYTISGAAQVAVTLSDRATLGAAFSAGSVYEIGGGEYSIDWPDAMFATDGSQVRIRGDASGKHVIADAIDVRYAELSDDQVDAIATAVSEAGGGGAAGPGASANVITINNTTTGQPVADADVWITSDAAGTTTIAGTSQTNSSGQVTFMLDAGVTYYLWMQKDGTNPILGTEFEAT